MEALPGWEVPKGCFVGVRLNETLKQRRLEPDSASYSFPEPAKRTPLGGAAGVNGLRSAKIDVYQHAGGLAGLLRGGRGGLGGAGDGSEAPGDGGGLDHSGRPGDDEVAGDLEAIHAGGAVRCPPKRSQDRRQAAEETKEP